MKRKPKTVRMEPEQMWATVDDNGIYCAYVFHTRGEARADMREAKNLWDGQFRVARVEIREVAK